MKYTITEAGEWEDPTNVWVSVDVTVGGRTFQVWIDEHGFSVAIEPEEDDDRFWVPTGVSQEWADLKAHPIEEEA